MADITIEEIGNPQCVEVIKYEEIGAGLTPESVLRLPLFENDNEASSLIQYSPYRTSTGEIRFKLPTVEPTGLWDFAAIWDFTKLWNI